MEIKLKVAENVYLLKSYGNQFMTAKELNSIDERTGKRPLSDRHYHTTLKDAFTYLSKKGIRDFTAATLLQLLAELKELTKTIKEVSKDG